MAAEVKPAPRHHFGVEAAKEFRQEHAAAYSETGAQEPAAPAAPAQEPAAPAAPASQAAPAAPAQEPASPAAPQPSIFDLGIEPPASAPATDPQQPSEREMQLQAEIEQLRAQNGELTAAQQQAIQQREAEQRELEELRELRRQQEVDRLLNFEGLEMDSIDPAAAQEIGKKLVRPILERQQQAFEQRLAELQGSMEQDRREREAIVSRMSESEQNALRAATNRRIFEAHPDFKQLRGSKEFGQFMNSTIKGSSLKLEKLIADEYHSGNADFVIQAINEFKKGRPSLEDIASVQAAGTGSEPASQANNEPELTPADIEKWNTMVITGEMSRAEFRENMAKYRAAHAPAR